jgi:hypothetical protein
MWIGGIEEIPGFKCQERSKDELMASFRETLREALDANIASLTRRNLR